jgi:hypothetical protein
MEASGSCYVLISQLSGNERHRVAEDMRQTLREHPILSGGLMGGVADSLSYVKRRRFLAETQLCV